MSIPDAWIDEPCDPEYCTIHEAIRPCPYCADDELDRRHDTRKEREP